jgi:hypothetical protein
VIARRILNMYTIKKVRRKVLIGSEYKVITLWECIAKFGTHGSTVVFLKDEPKDNIKTMGLKWEPNIPLYNLPWYSFRIEKVRPDGFVFLILE